MHLFYCLQIWQLFESCQISPLIRFDEVLNKLAVSLKNVRKSALSSILKQLFSLAFGLCGGLCLFDHINAHSVTFFNNK